MIENWIEEQERMAADAEKSKGQECKASWQVSSVSGALYIIRCRVCGTLVQSGCIPKCLLKQD